MITAAKRKTTNANATDIILSRYPEDARLYSEATRQNARQSEEDMNSQKDGEGIRTISEQETRQAREQTKLLAEGSISVSQVSDQVTRGAVGMASMSAENEELVTKIRKEQKTEEKERAEKSKKRQMEDEQNPKEGTSKRGAYGEILCNNVMLEMSQQSRGEPQVCGNEQAVQEKRYK